MRDRGRWRSSRIPTRKGIPHRADRSLANVGHHVPDTGSLMHAGWCPCSQRGSKTSRSAWTNRMRQSKARDLSSPLYAPLAWLANLRTPPPLVTPNGTAQNTKQLSKTPTSSPTPSTTSTRWAPSSKWRPTSVGTWNWLAGYCGSVSPATQRHSHPVPYFFFFLLQVMKKVETLRALGIPSVPEEEVRSLRQWHGLLASLHLAVTLSRHRHLQVFRDRLQTLRRELNQPDSSKSRLNEITSLVRMQDEMQDLNYDTIDEENMDKIFQVRLDHNPSSANLSLSVADRRHNWRHVLHAGPAAAAGGTGPADRDRDERLAGHEPHAEQRHGPVRRGGPCECARAERKRRPCLVPTNGGAWGKNQFRYFLEFASVSGQLSPTFPPPPPRYAGPAPPQHLFVAYIIIIIILPTGQY